MARRKPRKYYKPHTATTRAKISASCKAYRARCREALALVDGLQGAAL